MERPPLRPRVHFNGDFPASEGIVLVALSDDGDAYFYDPVHKDQADEVAGNIFTAFPNVYEVDYYPLDRILEEQLLWN